MPAVMPIRAPKLSPTRAQAHRIERAEDEADERLAADEAGNRPVDVAGDGADRVPMAHRHPGIHGAHHAIPVDEHVEGHHRRHDQQGEDADQRLPAGPQALQERSDPGDALADEVADGGRRRRQGILEPKLPDQRAELLGPQFLKSRHIAGQPFHESRHLLRREGNQDHEGDDEDQDEEDQDEQA